MQTDNESSSEGRDGGRVIHELRNAINAMVTSGTCLQRCESIPVQFQRFVRAINANGEVARELLDELDGIAEPPAEEAE